MEKRILLIRTFKDVGAGGPLPPLELLYIASAIMRSFDHKYQIKIIDTGLGNLSLSDIKVILNGFNPGIICLNALVWEAGLVHQIASLAKANNKNVYVFVQGQLATLAKDCLLQDENIDYVVIAEADKTVCELLEVLENGHNPEAVDGIIFREKSNIVATRPRSFINNLDDFQIPGSTWDLIPIKEYARYPNWNGNLKEKFYIPILTSRGCPFNCIFCCNRECFGKRFRARSAENVFSEIMLLREKYNVKEIHIYDIVFNYDPERVKQICRLIINSKIDLSLAFPHGLRADLMNDELITLLRKAGTYKLVYGIETASARLQRKVGKNLNLEQVTNIINKTHQAGIIVGGYFILGFPNETVDEMRQTIDFAANSNLDLAYFFKATRFADIVDIYKSRVNPINQIQIETALGLCYYSKNKFTQGLSSTELNKILLEGQQKFYLNFNRLRRGFVKSTDKVNFLKNMFNLAAIMLQGYLTKQLAKEEFSKRNA
ncbi:B12-binding domain-containing radical SAM protein [Candidatus Omnitrophota bacterium]